MSQYEAGQRWTYRCRECDQGTTLLIGEVQSRLLRAAIVHISVDGLRGDPSGSPTCIGHMPFSVAALNKSVLDLVATDVPVDDSLREGMATWAANKGGVFDIPVVEALDAVLGVLRKPVDHFDALVVKMRAERSEALVYELYRELFRLEAWYFLCRPDEPQAPVERVFPQGHNKTPALLAFTSQQRAAAAAIELGIYPAGSEVSIQPAAVKEAVEWVNGPHCSNTWICFNLTFENFPLYCDQAASLLAEL